MPLMQRAWREGYDKKYGGRPNPPSVFHIGYHKTGTTFVQRNIIPQLDEDKRFQIASNEAMSGYDLRDDLACGDLIADINSDAKIIVTIRSQLSMYSSYYWLYVKGGGVLSLEKFIQECIQNRKFDYYRMYQALLQNFDSSNILVLPFELLKNNRDEFLDQYLGFISDDLIGQVGYNVNKINNSPSLFAINFIRLINKLIEGVRPLTPLQRFFVKRVGWVEVLFFCSKKRVKDSITPKLKAQIENAYKDSNNEMQKHVMWNLEELGYSVR